MTPPVSPSTTPLKPNGNAPQWHHPTATKVAIVAATILLGVAVVGALTVAAVVPFTAIPIVGAWYLLAGGGVGSILCALKSCWASRKKEALSFQEYVEKKCPGHDLETVNGWADTGKEILNNIHSDVTPTIDDLKCVSWHFMRCAFNTGQGFEKGMITFEDPDNEIVNFFTPIMYTRFSSHFKKERLSSFGCDVPKGLSYIFHHVHMGTLKNGGSFIKFEEYGCSGCVDTIFHILNLLRANLARCLGEYDGPNDRKEKLGNEVKLDQVQLGIVSEDPF